MPPAPFLPIVFMVLVLGVLVYVLVRGPATPRGDGPKSSLARDGGLGGIGFLIPSAQHADVKALREGKTKV